MNDIPIPWGNIYTKELVSPCTLNSYHGNSLTSDQVWICCRYKAASPSPPPPGRSNQLYNGWNRSTVHGQQAWGLEQEWDTKIILTPRITWNRNTVARNCATFSWGFHLLYTAQHVQLGYFSQSRLGRWLLFHILQTLHSLRLTPEFISKRWPVLSPGRSKGKRPGDKTKVWHEVF